MSEVVVSLFHVRMKERCRAVSKKRLRITAGRTRRKIPKSSFYTNPAASLTWKAGRWSSLFPIAESYGLRLIQGAGGA